MHKKYRIRLAGSCSGNRKSKIQNRKLVGIIALVLTFAMCGDVAQAQQPGKTSRIGIQTKTSKSSGAREAGWTRWLTVSQSSAFTLRAPSSMPVIPTNTWQASRRLLSRAPSFGLRCSPSGGTSSAEERWCESIIDRVA
jgi:hypothetical protein